MGRRIMQSIEEKREYRRKPFVNPIRYSITDSNINIEEFEIFDNHGVSLDISEGGLGMITDSSLKTGDILLFEYGIEIKNNIVVKTSIVKWAREIENNRYRVGLKFFAYIDQNHVIHFMNNI